MSYRVWWAPGVHVNTPDYMFDEDENLSLAYPCFASLDEGVIARDSKLTVWFTMFNGSMWAGGDRNTPDYSLKVLDTSRLTRLVNYWIEIGKRIGLKFDNLEWSYDKEKKYLRFTLDNSYLNDLKKCNKKKLVHLHLFFLRLLNERSVTVMFLRKYRTRLRKEFPDMSLLTTVMLAEKWGENTIKQEYVLHEDQKTVDVPEDGVLKAVGGGVGKRCDITGASYNCCGHHLFTGFPTVRLKRANKIKDLFKAFMKRPTMYDFDSQLLKVVGENRHLIYKTYHQEAIVINEKKKPARI